MACIAWLSFATPYKIFLRNNDYWIGIHNARYKHKVIRRLENAVEVVHVRLYQAEEKRSVAASIGLRR